MDLITSEMGDGIFIYPDEKYKTLGFTKDLFEGSFLHIDKVEKVITLSCINSLVPNQGNFLNLLDHLRQTGFNMSASHVSPRMEMILDGYGFIKQGDDYFYNNLIHGNYYHNPELKERIICSAIWVKTNKHEKYNYYITPGATCYSDALGFIFTGISHADAMCSMHDHELKSYFPLTSKNSSQGFVTNRRRYVDRKLGWKIACRARQVDEDKIQREGSLFSENLY